MAKVLLGSNDGLSSSWVQRTSGCGHNSMWTVHDEQRVAMYLDRQVNLGGIISERRRFSEDGMWNGEGGKTSRQACSVFVIEDVCEVAMLDAGADGGLYYEQKKQQSRRSVRAWATCKYIGSVRFRFLTGHVTPNDKADLTRQRITIMLTCDLSGFHHPVIYGDNLRHNVAVSDTNYRCYVHASITVPSGSIHALLTSPSSPTLQKREPSPRVSLFCRTGLHLSPQQQATPPDDDDNLDNDRHPSTTTYLTMAPSSRRRVVVSHPHRRIFSASFFAVWFS
ncbi:hypothetical protein BDN72DRAFT_856248 [Pluteus cervinus]|uniref:Uncharacterized protein n=1 Tax=Pluteus cervinus TaxID=181527 RepID=A0ACD3AZ97_9AGAR|nr:hypothetical protein BDN72DRAFT_856248 [Pluteus cervinus]